MKPFSCHFFAPFFARSLSQHLAQFSGARSGETLGGLDLGASFTNVPGGTAYWVFRDVTGNYNYARGRVPIDIKKANPTTTGISGYTGTYDGDAHGASGFVTGVKGETLGGLDLGASFTNVPGGTANWIFTDVTGNYNNASGSVGIAVGKAPLSVTANNQTKTFGDVFTFLGTEFTSAGLVNVETIGTVTLASAGAAADAPVAGSPYSITPSAATGGTFDASNYTITYNPGLLTVTPAPPVTTPAADTTAQMSLLESPRAPLPDQTDMANYQVNTFTPPIGPAYVYFYQPPTPYDMAAFDAMTLSAGDLQFLNGVIGLMGHEGLMPGGLDERRRTPGVS